MHVGLRSTVLLAGMVLAMAVSVRADLTLIDSDFNSPDTTTTTILPSSGTTTATIDGLSANVPTGFGLNVAQVSGNNNALQMVDNSSSTNANFYLRQRITSGISTTAAGDNHITGSFELTRLLSPAQGEGSFRLLIGNQNNTNGVQYVYLRLSDNQIQYNNGTNTPTLAATGPTGFSVNVGTTYVFGIDLDLSSTTQDTWSFTISDLAGNLLFSSKDVLGALPTGIADGTPVDFVFSGGLNAAKMSSSPFVQLDNIHFSASPIPEPACLSIAMTSLGGWSMKRRRCRRASRLG